MLVELVGFLEAFVDCFCLRHRSDRLGLLRRLTNLINGVSVTANNPPLRAAKPRGNPKGICIAGPDLVESGFFHLAKN